MLDDFRERERLREERQRVRADMLAERLSDDADASADATTFRKIGRAISWQPERMRYRLLLAVPGLVGIALAYYLVYFHDVPSTIGFIVAGIIPIVLAVLTTLGARGYAARREREEDVASRQRGAR